MNAITAIRRDDAADSGADARDYSGGLFVEQQREVFEFVASSDYFSGRRGWRCVKRRWMRRTASNTARGHHHGA